MTSQRISGTDEQDAAASPTKVTVSAGPSLRLTNGDRDFIEHERGACLGNYVILDKLGAGGMGIVYSAYDPHLDRKVALKVLRTAFDDEIEVARARLIREGRALARLNHPNVVTVHDVDRVDDEVYIAMELVQGQTLKQWRQAKTRAWQEVVAVFAEVAAGLIAVHEAGLVHRDVKPDNVLIDGEGRARVTDFGLARPGDKRTPNAEELSAGPKNHPEDPLQVDLTQSGARLGTPAYMAKELLDGGPASARSDQFAFCVALWETLYGKRPFAGDTWISLTVAINRGEISEPPKRPDAGPVPQWLRRVVERGLAPEPDDRWASMRELRDALMAGDPNRRRRRAWGIGGLLLVGGGAAAGMAVVQKAERDDAVAACHREGTAIETTWSAGARDRVAKSFAAADRPAAESTAREVIDALDAHAARWNELRTEVCLHGTVERSVDAETTTRAVDCLEQYRSGFDALVQVFEDADDVVVARAKRSVEGLADLEQCGDERRLSNQPPLPSDSKTRAEVRALHETLARTQVHEHIGRFDEGLELSRDALARALNTEHLPVIALARYRVAVFLEKRGEYAQAVEQWASCFHDAALAGHEQLAAEAATALAFCEGYQLERHDTGIRWAQVAGVFIERLDLGETLTEATRLDVLAVLREMKGDYEVSIETHERALEIRRANVGTDHHSVGYGLVNLAGVLEQTGELQRARELLVEARGIFERSFGVDNPTTAHVLHNLANLHEKLGEYEEAESLLARVLEVWHETLGPEHPDVGDVQNALGDLRTVQGRFEDAAQMYETGLRIHRASLPEDHPLVAQSALELGQALFRLQRMDEAQAHFELAVQTLGQPTLEQRDRLGRALHGLGSIALARGQAGPAREHFERSIAAFEAHPGEHADWVARARVGLAAVSLLHGNGRDAARILDAFASDASLPVRVRAEAAGWQARAAVAAGDAATARDQRARAQALAAEGTPGLQRELGTLLAD